MFGSGIISTLGDDLAWLQQNAFLVFGIVLFIIILIVLAITAVK